MKGFDILPVLTVRAKTSPFWLWVLNRALGRVVPFNRPHGFELLEIRDDVIRTTAPYRRVNCNHVRGIHACAIATTAEFSSGFLLLTKLDPRHYRLIMSRIEVDYHYQAKQQIVSMSAISPAILEKELYEPLRTKDTVAIRLESRVSDLLENDIAVAFTTWQIKRWDKVQTKL